MLEVISIIIAGIALIISLFGIYHDSAYHNLDEIKEYYKSSCEQEILVEFPTALYDFFMEPTDKNYQMCYENIINLTRRLYFFHLYTPRLYDELKEIIMAIDDGLINYIIIEDNSERNNLQKKIETNAYNLYHLIFDLSYLDLMKYKRK